MTNALRTIFLVGLLSLSARVASGQVATGTPPFGSYATSSADTVNLGNLNVHIDMPVLHKAGRGVPFNYDITYDTSFWAPPSVTGGSTWQPVGPPNESFGWFFPLQGALRPIATESFCGSPYPTGGTIAFAFVYYDPTGTPHPLQGSAVYTWGTCGTNTWTFYSGGPALDGSGYTVSGNSVGDATVTARDGHVVAYGYSGGGYVQPVWTDDNGNEVTVDTSDSIFTDTLGDAALTLAGSGTPSSPKTFTYTAPSGAQPEYKLVYSSYTVKTNFGCSGISEYGPTAQNLPSELDLPDGTKYLFTYEATPSYSGDVTGRLASVKLPTGGTVYYTYTGTHDGIECTDASTAGLTRQTPDGTWTYSRTLNGGAASATTITDPQNNQTVMDFIGIYPAEAQVYQGTTSGTLLKTTITCYNGSTPTGSPATCNSASLNLPIKEVTGYSKWPDGLESEVDTKYDSTGYGLVTERDEYGYGTNSPGSLVRKTIIQYASLSNSIVDDPSSVTVCSGTGSASACNNAGTVVAQTTYAYDQGSVTTTSGTPQHISVSGSRGNVTTISSLVSGSTYLTKTLTYFDTGNVQTATDVNGAQTTNTYGACENSFMSAVSEPLSLSRSMAWNCTGAVETSVTDENGKTVSASYTDSDFWRPASTTDQLTNVINITYNGQNSVEAALNFASSTSDILTTLDSLGRSELSQRRQAPGSGSFDSVETYYDALGRPYKTSLPYAANAGTTCSGSCAGTSTTYDTLGRPLTVTDGGSGTITYSYVGNDVLETVGPAPTGENTKSKQLEYDALGRLTSVCEITSVTGSGSCGQTNPETGYLTTYTYDLNNNLTGVTQNAQSSSTQTRSYTYDALSRMTSETNPESSATSYTFDSDSTCGTSMGDLVKSVDAVGNVTCYAHDALHRTTSTTYSGPYSSVTPSRYLVYDSATVNSVAMTNAKAHLAEAYTCVSPCSSKLTDEGFSYTARGETSDIYESTPHSGGYYHVNETYWANGALDQLSGLSGLPTITYTVDGEGRTYTASASSGQNPLSSTSYSAATLPTQVTLGSGDSDSYAYDPNTNRMTQYKFTVNGSSLTGNLTWNANGSLASLLITDPFNSADTQSCSYSHDDLARIASANCGSTWSQTFSYYDAFGNLEKTGSSSFQATYSYLTNRMTQIGSSNPTYDANGNVTNDFLNTYSWDANSRPVTIDSVNVTYDALGRMVEQNKSGTYSEIVYDPLGNKLAFMSGQSLSKAYVPLPAGDVATYGSSGLSNYHHADWLANFRLASTPTRTVPYDTAYGPFGELYAQSGSYTAAFTGQTQDTAPNVYDFPAREYGNQGRWPSPDPAGIAAVDPTDPQTWNRYAYVRNSPLEMADHTGLCGAWVTVTDYQGGEGWDESDDSPCGFWYVLQYFGYGGFLGGYGGYYPSGGGGGGSGRGGGGTVSGKQPDTRCPGKLTSGLVSGLITGLPPFNAAHLTAMSTGRVVTLGYDANLATSFGTLGFAAHAGDALAFDPQGGIAYLSTTGAGGGYGGEVGLSGQLGILNASSVTQLESGSAATFSIAGGAEVQGGIATDSDGNITLSAGAGGGLAVTSTLDQTTVTLLACGPG